MSYKEQDFIKTSAIDINKELSWEKEFDEQFNWEEIFGKNSKAQQSVKQFIKDLRKKDEEEIFKLFYGFKLTKWGDECEVLDELDRLKEYIKDYYKE